MLNGERFAVLDREFFGNFIFNTDYLAVWYIKFLYLINFLDRLCSYDNVTISSKNLHLDPNVWCGVKGPDPIITRDKIEITFSTDKWVTKRGFKFMYHIDGKQTNRL